MAATLQALVSALDDDPYCGTKPPHWPFGPLRAGTIQEIIATREAEVALNPQPLPPIARDTAAAAFQQVRLFQLGRSLQAHAARSPRWAARSAASPPTCSTAPAAACR